MNDEKLYLGAWNLHGERHVEIELPEINAVSAKVAYPVKLDTVYSLKDNVLTVDFNEDEQARLFEIELTH